MLFDWLYYVRLCCHKGPISSRYSAPGERECRGTERRALAWEDCLRVDLLGDAFKGAIVIMIARYLEYSEPIQLLGLGLAIVGHLKPFTLRFKGGKGISTFIGGIIIFEPLVVPVILLAFLILYPFTKSFTFAGLGAFLFIPVFLVFMHVGWITCLIVVAILAIIFLAHSDNIKERLKINH